MCNCFKIRSNPKIGPIDQMHCIYKNLDNILEVIHYFCQEVFSKITQLGIKLKCDSMKKL